MNLLFVCLGNICRSPAAEAIMVKLSSDAGLGNRFRCESAGTSGYHQGEPADPRMQVALQGRGYTVQSHSRAVVSEDFSAFDLILAMDKSNLSELKRFCPSPVDREKIKLMCDYSQKRQVSEIPDPYYGGPDGFQVVIDLLEEACGGLLSYLQDNHQASP